MGNIQGLGSLPVGAPSPLSFRSLFQVPAQVPVRVPLAVAGPQRRSRSTLDLTIGEKDETQTG